MPAQPDPAVVAHAQHIRVREPRSSGGTGSTWTLTSRRASRCSARRRSRRAVRAGSRRHVAEVATTTPARARVRDTAARPVPAPARARRPRRPAGSGWRSPSVTRTRTRSPGSVCGRRPRARPSGPRSDRRARRVRRRAPPWRRPAIRRRWSLLVPVAVPVYRAVGRATRLHAGPDDRRALSGRRRPTIGRRAVRRRVGRLVRGRRRWRGRPVAREAASSRRRRRLLGEVTAPQVTGARWCPVGASLGSCRRPQLVGHAGHHHAGREQQSALQPQRGLVVQQLLPPAPDHVLRDEHRDDVARARAPDAADVATVGGLSPGRATTGPSQARDPAGSSHSETTAWSRRGRCRLRPPRSRWAATPGRHNARIAGLCSLDTSTIACTREGRPWSESSTSSSSESRS